MSTPHGHAEGSEDLSDVESRLIALLDEGLSDAECASLRAEILRCPECRARLEREEALRRLLRSCFHSVRAPEGLRERVTYQLRVTRWQFPG